MWKIMNITPIYVQIHQILNELGQIYHSENGRPPNEYGLVVKDKWIH